MKATENTEVTEINKYKNRTYYPHSDITEKIIQASIEVHKILGPGFMENIYEKALMYELSKIGMKYECQKPIEVPYKEIKAGEHRIDLIVEDAVIVELKAIKNFESIHRAILISYLKATDKEIGLLLNFGNTKLQIDRLIF